MLASSPPLDALIIGAGWSGLNLSLLLSKAGKKVVCLEARKRIGGRAFTHSWNEDTPMENNERTLPGSEKGYVVDFGCSYIHGYEEGNPVKEIAKRYGVNVVVSKPTASQIIGSHGALSKASSAKLLGNLNAAQTAAKSLAKEKRANGKASSSALPLSPSLSSFLFDEKASPLFSNLSEEEQGQVRQLSRMMHVPLGTEIENIALDHYGYEEAFGGTDGIPEGGFSRLISLLAQDVDAHGGEIKTGQVVEKISSLGKGKGVRVEVSAGSEQGKAQVLEAKTAIVTVPLSVLRAKQQSLFEPSLRAEKQEAIEKTTVGNLNKVLLMYERPWWSLDVGTFFVLPSSKGSSSSSSSDSSKNASSPTLESIFSSHTLIVNSLCAAETGLPSSVTSPSLLVMVGATAAKQLEQFSRLEVAQALDKYLTQRLLQADDSKEGKSNKPTLKHTFYSRWARQEFTGGATTTPVTIGNSPSDFSTLASPDWDDCLYFAGEHCEVNHRGSIAGAVVSSQTTSEQVLKHLASLGSPSAKH